MIPKRLAVVISSLLLVSFLMWATSGSLVWKVLSPVALAWNSLQISIVHQGEERIAKHLLLEEKRRLEERVLQLEGQMNHLVELEKENERLKELLKASRMVDRPSVVARVVYRSPNNWYETLVLDKGKTSGIKENSVVMNGRGIIGRVVRVDESTCVVRLLCDPQVEISALNQRSRDVVILQGDYNEEMKGKLIPPHVDLQKGDVLVSSGLGGIYPRGIAIGTIHWIKKEDTNPSPRIRVALAVDIDRLEEVLVVAPVLP